MQRIEADPVGAKISGQFKQGGEIGKVANAPIALRADTVKLDGQQPAAIEIAAVGL